MPVHVTYSEPNTSNIRSNDKPNKQARHVLVSLTVRYHKDTTRLTERKRRRREAQIDTTVVGDVRQALGDEEGVLRVEMHHLLGWGRTVGAEAAVGGFLLLLELLLRIVHAEIWIVLLLWLLACELRPLHAATWVGQGALSRYRRASFERRPAIVVSLWPCTAHAWAWVVFGSEFPGFF